MEIVLSWRKPANVLPIAMVVVMGCFMEQVSIMMITIPIFMPIAGAMNSSHLVCGASASVCLEIGQLTPPFGLALFVMKGVAPKEISMTDVYSCRTLRGVQLHWYSTVISFPALATRLPGFLQPAENMRSR